MAMSTLTIELDDNRLKTLRKWADEAGLKVEDLARDLLEAQAETAELDTEFTPEQRAAIDAGLDAIERGDVIDHDVVMAKARSIVGL
jgi:predicted transcriptional regulator